jgi:hypothetical protein
VRLAEPGAAGRVIGAEPRFITRTFTSRGIEHATALKRLMLDAPRAHLSVASSQDLPHRFAAGDGEGSAERVVQFGRRGIAQAMIEGGQQVGWAD